MTKIPKYLKQSVVMLAASKLVESELTPAWQPDLPVSDEVEQAMQGLAEEVEAEAMLPWFLTEQAY